MSDPKQCKNCPAILANPIQIAAGFCSAYCLTAYDFEKELFMRHETERLNDIDGTWEATQ